MFASNFFDLFAECIADEVWFVEPEGVLSDYAPDILEQLFGDSDLLSFQS